MTIPPEDTYIQFTCLCTVFGCQRGMQITLLRKGTPEEMHRQCLAKLRELDWGSDRFGVLCDEHKKTHKVGAA